VATLLRGGTVVDLEPAVVEVADLRIEGERISERATVLEPRADDEIVDVRGRVLFPGLVSAHHHLSSALLRGLRRQGGGFGASLAAQHRLEDVMSHDDLAAAAAAGGLEALLNGTTTLFESTAAHGAVGGALDRVAQALSPLGLRTVLSHVVTDRAGVSVREAALAENAAFCAKAQGRLRGAFAVDGLGGLSDEALAAVQAGHQQANVMLLATLAEDPREEDESRQRFGQTATERLANLGLVGGRVVLNQGVHLAWPELSQLITQGTWLAHAARSNMASQAGVATPSKFGVRGCLATDVMSPDVFAEAQAAALRTNDSGQPIDLLRFLANGHRLATEAFGLPVGPLTPGAAADLLVLDYQPTTPLEAATLAEHVLHGLGARVVESVMVDGLWRVWKRKPLGLDAAEVGRAAAQAARGAWARMEESGARG
jgi:cytosine/adenosine deaminase-related metal-dependent hydrolase